ncbi:MAG: signal recognition particle-docking protein FtsY [Candidatus Woesearchaeota archaeon]
MFKFLKEKLKSTIANISDKIRKEAEDVEPSGQDQEEAKEETTEEFKDESEDLGIDIIEEPELPNVNINEEDFDLGIEQLDEPLARPGFKKEIKKEAKEDSKVTEKPDYSKKHPEEKKIFHEEVEVFEDNRDVEDKKSFIGSIKDRFFKKKEKVKDDVDDYVEIKVKDDKTKGKQSEEKRVEEEGLEEEGLEEEKEQVEEIDILQKESDADEPYPEPKEQEEEQSAAAEPSTEKGQVEEKKGLFKKIAESVVMKKISEKQFDTIFEDLEISLLENNVALEVIDKIKLDLKENIVDKPIRRGDIENKIIGSLKQSVEDLFIDNNINIFDMIEEKKKKKKPFVICFLGINGSGKTTTIAKIANMMLKKGYSVVLAAADTFRAAAIDQLQEHADNLKIKMIKHDYGSDPAAVAFDAIKHAEAKNIEVVLIDTAGRMHSNQNLTEEMKKIVRVAKPDLKIFVGESITGNDCVEQAKVFDEAISIDGIILSKADIDEKGGAAISVSFITKKPILFIGTGQEYGDIKAFDSNEIVGSIFIA